MALPKEPRQKMINLMYLVLTALLALNVSAEILNAFKTVNNSLNNANGIIDQKNGDIFRSFEAEKKEPNTAERAIIWAPKAASAKDLADNMITYIEGIKKEILNASKYDPKTGEYNEDELEATTRIMTEGPRGKDLHQKLIDFKANLLNVVPDQKPVFEKELPIDLSIPPSKNEASKNNWELSYFRMVPTVASLTILSKFENDVKNSEAMVVDYCHRQVGEVKYIYDAFQAFAGTNSQYFMPGQELQITAGVGAFSKASLPRISIDGSSVPIGPDGTALYKANVGGTGPYKKTITITFKTPAGRDSTVTREIAYTVGSPTGVTITPDAVKVLYIGLTNPISVTGGLKGAEGTKASITQGQITNKQNGHFDVTGLTTPGKATITVTTSDGKTASEEFRVRTIPPPAAKVGSSGGGRMSANEFKAQLGVRADMGEFIFEGVKYDVTNFTLIATGKGFEAIGPQAVENSGAYFSADAKRIIEMCKAGSSIILDRIKVAGPDGSKTLPGTIAFTLY